MRPVLETFFWVRYSALDRGLGGGQGIVSRSHSVAPSLPAGGLSPIISHAASPHPSCSLPPLPSFFLSNLVPLSRQRDFVRRKQLPLAAAVPVCCFFSFTSSRSFRLFYQTFTVNHPPSLLRAHSLVSHFRNTQTHADIPVSETLHAYSATSRVISLHLADQFDAESSTFWHTT